MFLPFLLLIGVVAFAAASSANSRGHYPSTPRIGRSGRGSPAPQLAQPGPIQVLGEYARQGMMPPPTVVLCAYAEAQSIGRMDLAQNIMQVFMLPVVQQNEERARVGAAKDANYQAPRSGPGLQHPAQPVHHQTPVPPAHHQPAPWTAPINPYGASNEEIQAMLDRDPNAFVQAAQSTYPDQTPAPAGTWIAPDGTPVYVEEGSERVDLSNDMGAQPGSDWDRQAQAPEPQRVPPIAGVATDAWDGFCERLKRESPTFQSQRHVGCYRQNKERLAELGIDPRHVANSQDAQREALDVDLADAHQHIVSSGLAQQHVGRAIRIPGIEQLVPVTLSGVLGIAQAAGLEGAASWLESQKDRRQFPHTTEAFVKTNGAF